MLRLRRVKGFRFTRAIKKFIHSSHLLKGRGGLGELSQSASKLRRDMETTQSSTIVLYVNNADCFLRLLCVVTLSACQLYTQTVHSSYQVYYLPRSFSAMHFFPMLTKASAKRPASALLPSFCCHMRSKAFALSRLQR